MAVEYGIITKDRKEKELVNALNKCLTTFFHGRQNYDIYKNHKLAKHKNRGGVSFDEDKIEWDYEYQYDYFNKPFGVYVELYPNTNEEGACKFSAEGVTWNLYIEEISFEQEPEMFMWEGKPCKKHPALAHLVPFLLQGIPFESVLIKEYGEGEERL